jgi:MerR HTH family regulatory protein
MPSSLAQGPIPAGLNTSKTDKNDVDEPLYTVRVVAERVGVPTATLRSWNQRYGVGPPEHSPGRHRLYSENDIAVVRRMYGLIVEGASPRSAARTAIDSVRPARGDTAALLVAAFDFDVFTAGLLLDRHLRHFGVLDTWDQLVRPAFAAIEQRQAAQRADARSGRPGQSTHRRGRTKGSPGGDAVVVAHGGHRRHSDGQCARETRIGEHRRTRLGCGDRDARGTADRQPRGRD